MRSSISAGIDIGGSSRHSPRLMPNGDEKLLAEWFWTDRWMGSSAFLLPMEPRGLYREMLTQAWRRGGRLPNNPDAIRRAVGCTLDEWDRCWPIVEQLWRVEGDDLSPKEGYLGFSKPLPGQTKHRPHIPLDVRRSVFNRDGRMCVRCGSETSLELDHVIPFSMGGPDIPDNLRVMCKACNVRRGVSCV
jgi:hypothetical protein